MHENDYKIGLHLLLKREKRSKFLRQNEHLSVIDETRYSSKQLILNSHVLLQELHLRSNLPRVRF